MRNFSHLSSLISQRFFLNSQLSSSPLSRQHTPCKANILAEEAYKSHTTSQCACMPTIRQIFFLMVYYCFYLSKYSTMWRLFKVEVIVSLLYDGENLNMPGVELGENCLYSHIHLHCISFNTIPYFCCYKARIKVHTYNLGRFLSFPDHRRVFLCRLGTERCNSIIWP